MDIRMFSIFHSCCVCLPLCSFGYETRY